MSRDMQVITNTIPQKRIVVSSPTPQTDLDWLNFFDTDIAITTTFAHVAALSGTKNAEKPSERHTFRAYHAGLYTFLEWSGDQLPTPALIKKFIAHLSTKYNHRTKSYGLSASTIASKYLAPIRLYLKSLAGQHIIGNRDTTYRITAYREQIRAALLVKSPGADIKSNLSPLMRYGTRLKKRLVNKLLRDIDCTGLQGKRDYALLMTAFNTGLRLAELQRITLDSISEEEDSYTVTVRGKRNNHDPVAIADSAVEAINDYVTSYNSTLDDHDPRRITTKTPVWQSLTRSGNILPQNHKTGIRDRTKEPVFYCPSKGMSTAGITYIIKHRAAVSPHDLRRTFAWLAFKAGMPIVDISKQMRHSSTSVTEVYIGILPDYSKSNLQNYITLG